MYTHILLEDDSRKVIKSFVLKLSNTIDKLISGNISITYGKDIIAMSPIDIIRAVSEISVNSSAELSVRNMFLSSIIESENRCKFSGFITALTACFAIRQHEKLKQLNAQQTYDDAKKEINNLSKRSHRISYDESLRIIKSLSRDKIVHSLLHEALVMAGSGGKILVDLTPCDDTVVSSFVGYKFSISPHHLFSLATKNQTWHRQNVVCLMIDGIVEKMSEIERIIQPLAENKTPGILFARGFDDEVVSTLAVNFLRKSLDVVPMIVPFDETGINMLNDIAVVVGGDVVSSLKGELISQKSKDDMLLINEVIIKPENTILFHDAFKENILNHVIRLKRESQKNSNSTGVPEIDKKRELIEKRISSLIGEGVQIKMGMSLGHRRGLTIDRLQTNLGIFKGACRFGSIDISNYQTSCALISYPIGKLKRVGNNIPTGALLTGLEMGLNTANNFSNLSVIISGDD